MQGAITVHTSVSDFTRGIVVGSANRITRVDAVTFPSLRGIQCAMTVTSINGRPTPTERQLLHELNAGQAAAAGDGALVLTLSPPQPEAVEQSKESSTLTATAKPSRGAVTPTGNTAVSDEFDLSSEEDEAPSQVAQSLPRKSELNTIAGQSSGNEGSSVGATASDDAPVWEAFRRVQPGGCIILLCEGINPALQVERAAEHEGCAVMHINAVARLKTRQSITDAGATLRKSLECGVWIYIEHATKSMTLLVELANRIDEVKQMGAMHPNARAFLMCEPHPHFPEQLLRGCALLQVRSSRTKVDVHEELLESNLRIQLMKGGDGSEKIGSVSTPLPKDYGADHSALRPLQRDQRGPLTASPAPEAGGGTSTVAPDASSKTVAVAPVKRRVKISNEVQVVQLETNTFMELSASAAHHLDRVGEPGDGIVLTAKYRFGSKEKLISLCQSGTNRYAVGTSNGYVVVLDDNGLPLIQFRPHRACVWDLSFSSSYDFATASEDGTSVVFRYSLADQEVIATSVASFQSDVFAVTYLQPNDVSSPVVSGGLGSTICVMHSDRLSSSFMQCPASIQAMCATQTEKVLVGGGDGTCTLVDPATCKIMFIGRAHPLKVPAVAALGSAAMTGGFDEHVRLWDLRSGFQCVSEIKVGVVVTAVAMQNNFAAACCGSTLHVWDVRQLRKPLVTKENAYGELSRGLIVDGNTIVTASIDGVARFWELTA